MTEIPTRLPPEQLGVSLLRLCQGERVFGIQVVDDNGEVVFEGQLVGQSLELDSNPYRSVPPRLNARLVHRDLYHEFSEVEDGLEAD